MLRLFTVFALLLATVPSALAQTPERIGAHGQWAAYTFKDGNNTVCYMASAPTKQEGKYTRRGDPYALVTNRPATKTEGEVNFIAGYVYKPDTEVTVRIGSQTFTLFTTEDRAWSEDPEADSKLVKAMVRGNTMIVEGVSKFDTETKDTYSLSGFTATKKVIDTACK